MPASNTSATITTAINPAAERPTHTLYHAHTGFFPKNVIPLPAADTPRPPSIPHPPRSAGATNAINRCLKRPYAKSKKTGKSCAKINALMGPQPGRLFPPQMNLPTVGQGWCLQPWLESGIRGRCQFVVSDVISFEPLRVPLTCQCELQVGDLFL
jgi:hypothetical protein